MTDIDEQLQVCCEQIRQAASGSARLRLRGGGSKDFWGPDHPAPFWSTRALTGIVSYEPSELVITARAGTPLQEIESALAREGQHLAFEPPHFGPQATLGGAVASGLSGPARASAGAVRDYVLGVQFINGSGQLLRFGGQVMKNVAGYDVSRLMAGSWGTLGLMTEVSLKVLPIAPGQATWVAQGLNQTRALELLQRWRGQALPLNASCWLPGPPPQLLIRLSGARAAVESAQERLGRDIAAAGGLAQPLEPAAATAHWQGCREQTLDFFKPPSQSACLWRLSLPPATPDLELAHPVLIEWHGAQRWLWAEAQQAQALMQRAQSAGGHASVFRAGADAQARGLVAQPSPALLRISRELQKQFDPHGVFNTGRLGF